MAPIMEHQPPSRRRHLTDRISRLPVEIQARKDGDNKSGNDAPDSYHSDRKRGGDHKRDSDSKNNNRDKDENHDKEDESDDEHDSDYEEDSKDKKKDGHRKAKDGDKQKTTSNEFASSLPHTPSTFSTTTSEAISSIFANPAPTLSQTSSENVPILSTNPPPTHLPSSSSVASSVLATESAQITTMTASTDQVSAILNPPISTGLLDTLSSQPPRKELDPPTPSLTNIGAASSTTTELNPTLSLAPALSNSTSYEDNELDREYTGNNDEGGSRSIGKDGDRDPTAEHVLIGAGSIAIFILVCSIFWFGWRVVKRRPGRVWGGSYAIGINGSPSTPRERTAYMWQASDRFFSRAPWLKRYMRGWHSLGEKQTWATPASQNPGGLRIAEREEGSSVPDAAYQSSLRERTTSAIPATDKSSITTSTLRSQPINGFFNQSELARQPSDAYDPTRREVNRISELSSLSSGFGDGDIVVTPTPTKPLPAITQPLNSNDDTLPPHFSWQDRSARETVYTETSEDTPARFRSVSSWVVQQRSRLTRAHKPNQDGQSSTPPPL